VAAEEEEERGTAATARECRVLILRLETRRARCDGSGGRGGEERRESARFRWRATVASPGRSLRLGFLLVSSGELLLGCV
jgi:hypothetical protein